MIGLGQELIRDVFAVHAGKGAEIEPYIGVRLIADEPEGKASAKVKPAKSNDGKLHNGWAVAVSGVTFQQIVFDAIPLAVAWYIYKLAHGDGGRPKKDEFAQVKASALATVRNLVNSPKYDGGKIEKAIDLLFLAQKRKQGKTKRILIARMDGRPEFKFAIGLKDDPEVAYAYLPSEASVFEVSGDKVSMIRQGQVPLKAVEA